MLWRTARRLVVAVIGGTVIVIGIALLVLPGPAVVVIPAGLAILATEFLWARRLLRRLRREGHKLWSRASGAPAGEAAPRPGSCRDSESP